MNQRECKKCLEVKPKRKFFTIVEFFMYDMKFVSVTWLCNKCADEVGYKAKVEEADKFDPHTKKA